MTTRRKTPPRDSKAIDTIADLTHDPENARKHNDRNVGAIVESLGEVGAARSIVIDEAGVILAGNATIAAARKAGLTKVHVVDVAGDTVVAVRRSGLTAREKRRLALADNRAAELATWDGDRLGQLHAEDPSLFHGMFTDAEILRLIPAAVPSVGNTDPDDVPDLRKTTKIKRGDMFALGDHVLLCGDSTNPKDAARVMGDSRAVLMNTDPPYGVKLDLEQTHAASNAAKGIKATYRNNGAIANDGLQGQDLRAFLSLFIAAALPILSKKAALYFWHPMLAEGAMFLEAAATAKILVHRQIVWVKPNFVFGRGDYHWQHELCFYGWVQGQRCPFYGARNQSTTWVLDEGGGKIRKDQNHPTQKPVELFTRPMRNHA